MRASAVMKKILTLMGMTVASLAFALPASAATPASGLDYCHGPQTFETPYEETSLCYTVERGDTLWGIADYYLGSGFQWKELFIRWDERKQTNAEEYLDYDPRTLQPGMKVTIDTSQMDPYRGYEYVDGSPVFDPQTGNIISWSRNADGTGVVTSGNKVYGGPYHFVRNISVSEDEKHLIYLADTKGEEERVCSNASHGFQLVVDGEENSHYSCGWDYKLLTFNPRNTEYAVRNNQGDGANPEQFIVLSSIGNGFSYDYIDSLMWADDETIVYRAQINDRWRIVINHRDQKVYDYIDNVRIEDGAIHFNARHEDGSWTEEKIER